MNDKDTDKKQPDDALRRLLDRAQAAPDANETAPADETQDTADNGSKRNATDGTKADGGGRQRRHRSSEQEERARRAFLRMTNIDEEDDDFNGRFSFNRIMGGDILASPRFRRQIWYVLFLALIAIVYISNRYACQREEIRREELNRSLADRKFKALTISAELTEYSMRSNVEQNVPDTTLTTSTTSSYVLPVDEADSLSDTPQ